MFGKGRSEKGFNEQARKQDQLVGKEYDSTPINWSEDERARLEKKFLRKLDLRMSILVVVSCMP